MVINNNIASEVFDYNDEIRFIVNRYHDLQDGKNRIKDFLEKGYYVVKCDASYDYMLKRGSAAVEVQCKERNYKPKKFTFESVGPVHSELRFIWYGFKVLEKIKKPIGEVLILNDNLFAINLVVGNFTPRRSYIRDIVDAIKRRMKEMKFEVEFGLVRSKTVRRVDRLAKKRIKCKGKEINQRINRRINIVRKRIEESKKFTRYRWIDNATIEIKDTASNYWFRVCLSPVPSCTCYWWRRRWGSKSKEIIKARALPCVHMCKAAEILNIDIFRLFQRQIYRKN